jgi:hypothetical protein
MIGQQAIAAARKASPKFLPAIPEIEIACGAANKTNEYIQEWENRAARQLADRKPFRDSPVKPNQLTDFDAATEKYGRPVGVLEAGTPWEHYAGRRSIMPKMKPGFKQFTNADLERLYARNTEAGNGQ